MGTLIFAVKFESTYSKGKPAIRQVKFPYICYASKRALQTDPVLNDKKVTDTLGQ